MARYRQIRVPVEHPVAFTTATYVSADGRSTLAWEHRVVLYEKIGPGTHPCHWCERTLVWRKGPAGHDTLVADHVDGDIRNNERDNLVPSCNRCNIKRGIRSVTDAELFIERADGSRVRANERQCRTCDSTFLIAAYRARRPKEGLYCSMRCMYNRSRT